MSSSASFFCNIPPHHCFLLWQIDVIRHNALCDGCGKCICNIRYKCMQCRDYDLCSQCKSRGIHNETGHSYLKIGDDRWCDECRNHFDFDDYTSKHYKCVLCVGYDLCYNCRRNGKHGHHDFICIEWEEDRLIARPSRKYNMQVFTLTGFFLVLPPVSHSFLWQHLALS